MNISKCSSVQFTNDQQLTKFSRRKKEAGHERCEAPRGNNKNRGTADLAGYRKTHNLHHHGCPWSRYISQKTDKEGSLSSKNRPTVAACLDLCRNQCVTTGDHNGNGNRDGNENGRQRRPEKDSNHLRAVRNMTDDAPPVQSSATEPGQEVEVNLQTVYA